MAKTTSKKILWIDDDINDARLMPYADEFEGQGFTIVGVDNPDDIEETLSLNKNNFLCIIVDMAMPFGNKLNYGETKGGLLTGLTVLKELVENVKLNGVKKVVFTITDDSEVKVYCKKQQIPYFQKQKYSTSELVEQIRKITTNQPVKQKSNGRKKKV